MTTTATTAATYDDRAQNVPLSVARVGMESARHAYVAASNECKSAAAAAWVDAAEICIHVARRHHNRRPQMAAYAAIHDARAAAYIAAAESRAEDAVRAAMDAAGVIAWTGDGCRADAADDVSRAVAGAAAADAAVRDAVRLAFAGIDAGADFARLTEAAATATRAGDLTRAVREAAYAMANAMHWPDDYDNHAAIADADDVADRAVVRLRAAVRAFKCGR